MRYIHMLPSRLCWSCLLAILVLPLSAKAAWLDVFRQRPGAASWQVDWPEVANAAEFVFSTTMPGSWPKWNRMNPDFTNPDFESYYGDRGSFLSLGAPDPFGEKGVTTVNISFDEPLAAGTRLVVLDIDARKEWMALHSDLGRLGTPETTETMLGNGSTFARWDGSRSQQLTTVVNGIRNNDREAYIWDASGMQDLTVTYSTKEGGGQLGFFRPDALPPDAVLVGEPVSASLLVLGLCGLAAHRSARNRKRRRQAAAQITRGVDLPLQSTAS